MKPAFQRAGKPASRVVSLLLATCLSGCAACLPAPKVEAVPVGVPCVATRPVSPALPTVPAHGIFEQAQALLAREQLRAAYARQLEMLLDACSPD
ncbi:hypothetical protein D3C81_834710 [compost metagenome]